MTEYLAPTKRKKISKREAARLFLVHQGICCLCGQQIRGRRWFIEHVDALVLGGQETDDNRRPAHLKCKADKDAADAAARSKRDAIITQDWQRGGPEPRKLSGPGFRKAKPQRRASTPIAGKFEGDIMARKISTQETTHEA